MKKIIISMLVAAGMNVHAQGTINDTFPYSICCGVGDSSALLADSELLYVAARATRGGRTVRIHRKERPLVSVDWNSSKVDFTTSYRITAVTGYKSGRVLFVAGIKADGNDIVERWVFSYRNGRIISKVAPGTNPIIIAGAPQASASWVTGTAGSDFLSDPFQIPYTPPAHIGNIPSPQRTVVYDPEANVGHIRNMNVDPEGRFLLFQLHSTSELYLWNFATSTLPMSPALAFENLVMGPDGPSGLSILSKNSITTSVYDHPVEGRILKIYSMAPSFSTTEIDYGAMKDIDNDGVWDSTEVWTSNEWTADSFRKEIVPAIPH